MTRFWALWQREASSNFRTSIAYVVGVLFLLTTGFSFWMVSAHLAQGAVEGELTSLLFGSPWFWLAMLIVTPLLTMRLFAEERRSGTFEVLMSAPVTETEVVLAKFAGAFSSFLLLWIPTLAYVAILRRCGGQLPELDWGAVAAGYLGTALIGAFFLAVGLLGSMLTRHQVVAAMVCLAALGLLLTAGLLPFYVHSGPIQRFARVVSAPLHMADFAAGVVDSRTIVWYLGATILLLFISIRILEARRLR